MGSPPCYSPLRRDAVDRSFCRSGVLAALWTPPSRTGQVERSHLLLFAFLLGSSPVWVVRTVPVLKNAVPEPSRAAYCISTALFSLCMVLRVLLGLEWLLMYLPHAPPLSWSAFGAVVVYQRAREKREPLFFSGEETWRGQGNKHILVLQRRVGVAQSLERSAP